MFRRVVGSLFVLICPAMAADNDGANYFEKNVRPLLAQKCLMCHTGASPMGGLALDSRDALLKGGTRGPAIVAGKADESLLIRAVRRTDDQLKMPPTGSLKDAEVATLASWIAQGAPWGTTVAKQPPAQKHWAFVKPSRPALPAVADTKWAQSPIDAFILAALESKGLKPAAPADKRTLIRRATFDLTGLPPTPQEVEDFLRDSSPGAFAKVVDRLLASPRYGERWGRHWLDVARYADSNGLDENLVYKNAFRYRDYVIAAFNKDKPYDQFVHEQIAGDLLPDTGDLATRFERWTATGFLSLGAKMLAEDDPVKMEVDIVDEQLDTTARTFMGLTVGCARCHDHKFDPIPTADYYSLAGIFKSSKTMENFKVVAQWHEYVLAPPHDLKRLAEHEKKVEAKRAEAAKLAGAENRKLSSEARTKAGAYLLAASDLMRYRKMTLRPADNPAAGVSRDASSFDSGNAPRELKKGDRNVPKDVKGPYFAEFVIDAPAAGNYQIDMFELETGGGTADILVGGLLMKKGAPPVENREASPDDGGWSAIAIVPLPKGRTVIRLEHRNRFPYFEKLLVSPSRLPPEATPLSEVQVARQYGVNPSYLEQMVDSMIRSKGAPHSILYAWESFEAGRKWTGGAWTSPAAKFFDGFEPKNREELAARYQQVFAEAMRQWQAHLATRPEASPADDMVEDLTAKKEEPKLADPGYDAMREFLYEKAGVFRSPGDSRQYFPADVRAQLEKLDEERKALADATPQFPRVMGVTEGKIANMPIHIRGSHWSLGQETPRQFLRAIAGDNQTPIGSSESGRLQLARWMTSPDHPLTSRVMANRIWRWHFGRGIVPSTDNFGRLGDAPSNQPLLDWLAAEFVERGWSIKQMHRLMMLSNTYQMSSAVNAKAAEVDPENTLLWRMPRRRLEVESIRDAITFVSGDLDTTMGGSILSYKDRQYVANTSKRGEIDYDVNRRAVYLPVVRSSMYDVFWAFDLPDPSTPSGDRNATIIAPQALFMMNGSLVLKQTRKMAKLLLAHAGDDAARVRLAYERALSRPPAPSEMDQALTFVAQMEKANASRASAPEERREFAWQSFCKALLASNEFIYLN